MSFDKEEVWRLLQQEPGTWYQEAPEDERELFRKWTRELLKERAVEVEFVKADGSVRTMTCTLNEGLGAVYINKTTELKERKQDACPVWDCDQESWRSFRWDRLKKIGFVIE